MSADTDHPLTLSDLERWDFSGTALAVVGHPIAHSLSPVMHNAALQSMALNDPRFRDWRYFKFDIAPEKLPVALKLFWEKKFLGLNLTVPHKSLALAHLSTTDDFVRAAGAANTLTRIRSGWWGANTDGYGLAFALRLDLGEPVRGSDIILLGAGGAARGAALECLRAECRSLWIGNRTIASAKKIITDLKPFTGATACHTFDPAELPTEIPAGATVINATSLGLAASDAAPIDLNRLASPARVYDMIYRPAQTTLLRQAAALSIPHANGLSMLVHQGARSFQLWSSGVTPPVDIMHAAVHRAL